MKLRHSPTSPYVRKVMAVAIEAGIDGQIELVSTNVWDPTTTIRDDNPLGKVPALTLDSGLVLFDSPVIAEYLDSLHEGIPLFPAPGPARWEALRLQAIGDGICDAAILRMLESRREDPKPSEQWMSRYAASMTAAMDVLEAEAGDLGNRATIGTLT
ncbi:MAG: glutathione S-transferase N-terminal domain-containing protein, partial [Pseudomonadota bacterium]